MSNASSAHSGYVAMRRQTRLIEAETLAVGMTEPMKQASSQGG